MVPIDVTSEQRIELTLKHIEPDRIPFDLGSTAVTGIHVDAYKRLLSYLSLEKKEILTLDMYQQTVKIHEDVLQRLLVDTRGLIPNPPSTWKLELFEEENYECFVNEWGIKWRKPKERGYYYDPIGYPLRGKIDKEMIDNYPWPDPTDPVRIQGLKEQAKEWQTSVQPALVMEGIGGEVFDSPFWLRGFEEFYVDLVSNASLTCYLMDKLVDFQMKYWEFVLKELSHYILIVRLGDDLGDQRGTRVSPEIYRKYLKPRHKRLFSFIKRVSGQRVYIFLHTCGSVYDIIPDLIEVGVDILNPVQVSAAKMDSRKLKKEFGKDLTFWGGGVDTQNVLPRGTPQQVRDEVKRRIDDLAPEGGFVFNPVHNIQFDVPPENVMAMWETWREYGVY